MEVLNKAIDVLNANPWMWGVVLYVLGALINEAAKAAEKRWPGNKTVLWLRDRALESLASLPGHATELRNKAPSVPPPADK